MFVKIWTQVSRKEKHATNHLDITYIYLSSPPWLARCVANHGWAADDRQEEEDDWLLEEKIARGVGVRVDFTLRWNFLWKY